MDFKRVIFYLITLGSLLFFTACSEKEKTNLDNTFYVELVNFTKDSLKQVVAENIFGKVSYYQKNELKIISTNYDQTLISK